MTRNVKNDLNVEAARDKAGAVRKASKRVREADETVTIRYRYTTRVSGEPPIESRYGELEGVEYTIGGRRRVRCEDDETYEMDELDECPGCGVLMTYLDNLTDACVECQGDGDE
ncbi:hypothetical protein D320_04757 [Haloferax sp. BAB-2207]|nr:hypothetical protein [Haloferax sp. BAB-2207]ELK55405.1 hypothetical protein D320_04757 [Haloferax sp. BAB-2207]